MFKLDREDYIDEVEDIITVGDFYGLADSNRTHIVLSDGSSGTDSGWPNSISFNRQFSALFRTLAVNACRTSN